MTAASATWSPAPPYSLGMSAASQPACVNASTNFSGYSCLRSTSRQYVSPKSAQSFRTAARICSRSGSLEKSISVPGRRRVPTRCGAARRDHEAADHHEDDRAIRLEPALPDLHDPPPAPRPRLACIEHFAIRVEGVALEQRARQLHLLPPDREPVLARVGDHQPRHDADCEHAVHKRSLELGLRRVVRVDVDRVLVVREKREPDVVGLRDGAASRRAMHVADLEVFEKRTVGHGRMLDASPQGESLGMVSAPAGGLEPPTMALTGPRSSS